MEEGDTSQTGATVDRGQKSNKKKRPKRSPKAASQNKGAPKKKQRRPAQIQGGDDDESTAAASEKGGHEADVWRNPNDDEEDWLPPGSTRSKKRANPDDSTAKAYTTRLREQEAAEKKKRLDERVEERGGQNVTEVSVAVGPGDQAQEEILYGDTTTTLRPSQGHNLHTGEEYLAVSNAREAALAALEGNPDGDQQQSQEEGEEKTD